MHSPNRKLTFQIAPVPHAFLFRKYFQNPFSFPFHQHPTFFLPFKGKVLRIFYSFSYVDLVFYLFFLLCRLRFLSFQGSHFHYKNIKNTKINFFHSLLFQHFLLCTADIVVHYHKVGTFFLNITFQVPM